MENQNEILDSQNISANSGTDLDPIISVNKFIFLSIVSFGLYQLWWVYKSWRFFKDRDMPDIMPAGRAIFSIFFLNSLFNRILEFAKRSGYTESYNSVSLYLGFILLNILSRLPDPFWIISIFSFVVFLPPLRAMNFAKQNSPEYNVTEQTSFNGRQIALTIIGVIFWGLVVLGLNADKFK